jgi:hypothetical protein
VLVKRALSLTLAAMGLLGLDWEANADVTKAECVKANAQAQTLRNDGKLAAARQQLAVCADPACPALVRDDCTQRMDEIERVQPTIVFDVKDASGSDVTSVRVTMDGQPLAAKLTGTALSVDPGEHAFTFSADGQLPVSRTFVIHEAEKDRRERVSLASSTTASPAAAATPDHESKPPSSGGMGTVKWLGIAAGGVGVIGVGVGGVLGALSVAAASSQKSDCASPTSCANHAQALSDHSTAVSDGAASTALLVVGGALLVTGVTLFFTAKPSSSRSTEGVVVVPTVGPGVAGVSLQWRL